MSRYGDKCNVTTCKEPHDDIPHTFTGHKYCFFCARKINDVNVPYGENDTMPFNQEDINKGLKILRKRDLESLT